jgi:hypothetical protein
MAKISSLWVEIGANSAKFTKELAKTNKHAKGWAAAIKLSVGKAAGVFGKVAAAVVATAGALLGLYKTQADNIDQLAKTSSKLNVLTADLQAVRAAADFAGVGKGIDTAMQRLTRRLAEAAQGTGSALDAVKQLNLDAADLASKTADEQLQTVLDKLQEIPPGAERVRLAFKFFDTEGVGLVNLTSDAIRKSREELDRWGVTVNEQQAAWVEATNDNLSRLGQFASGAGIQISTKLAPLIGAASEGMLAWAEDTINWGKVTDSVISLIKKAWLGLQVAFDGIKLVWVDLKIGFARFAAFVVEKIQPLQQAVIDLYNMLPGEDIDPAGTGLARTLEYLNASIESNRAEWRQLATDLNSVWENGLSNSTYGQALDNTLNEYKARAEAARQIQIDLQAQLASGLTPVAANQPVYSPATNIADKLKDDQKAQREHMRKMADEAKAVNSEVATLADMLGTGIKNSAEDASEAIRTMVADMLIHLTKLYFQGQINQSGSGGQSGIGGFLSGIVGGLMGFNSAPPAGATAASQSLSAGSTAAGYAPSVINVYATGESSSSVAATRNAVRSLQDAGPSQVAARAARGGSFAQGMAR